MATDAERSRPGSSGHYGHSNSSNRRSNSRRTDHHRLLLLLLDDDRLVQSLRLWKQNMVVNRDTGQTNLEFCFQINWILKKINK